MSQRTDYSWMRVVLRALFDESSDDDARNAIRSADALAALRQDLAQRALAGGRLGRIPEGDLGDNLILALLALRLKFDLETAFEKVEINIAMREQRTPVSESVATMTPQISARQTAINTVVVLGVLFGAWFIIQIRSTLVLLLVGILFAAALEPLVNRLRRRGLSRGQSILALYVVLLSLFALLVIAVAPSLIDQGTQLFDDVPTLLGDLREEAVSSESAFIRESGTRAIDEALAAYYRARAEPPIEGEQARRFAISIGGAVFAIATVFVVAFYWMTEKAIIKRLFLGLFPIDRRDRAHGLWDEIEARIGGWTRGQLLLCLVIGLLSTIAYWLIGLDFWLALGLFAGLTEIIPFLGPILGGAAAVMVALTDSWQKAVIVLIFAVALQQLEGAFLVPRVMRNAVGMTPLTVILAVLIGGSLAGPLGAVLAIPVGAAAQVLVSEVLYNRADDPDNRIRRRRLVEPRRDPTGDPPGAAADASPRTAVDVNNSR